MELAVDLGRFPKKFSCVLFCWGIITQIGAKNIYIYNVYIYTYELLWSEILV